MNYPLSPNSNNFPYPPPPPPFPAQNTTRAARRCYTRTGLALCVMLLVYLLLPSLVVALLQVLHVKVTLLVAYAISSLTLYGFAIPAFYLLMMGEKKAAPVQHSMSFGKLLLAFIMCYPLLYAGSWIGQIENFILSFFEGGGSNAVADITGDLGIGATFLFAVLLAPIFEELIFRKFLLDRIGKYGYAPAIALSGLVFGLFHGNFLQFFYAMFLGFFFAFIYLRTGKLRYTIILHMLVNFFGSIVPMVLDRFTGVFGLSSDAPTEMHLSGLIVMLCYVGVILGLLIAGLVLLIVFRRKFSLPSPPGEIEPGREHKLLFAPGVLFFVFLCVLFFLLSLY